MSPTIYKLFRGAECVAAGTAWEIMVWLIKNGAQPSEFHWERA